MLSLSGNIAQSYVNYFTATRSHFQPSGRHQLRTQLGCNTDGGGRSGQATQPLQNIHTSTGNEGLRYKPNIDLILAPISELYIVENNLEHLDHGCADRFTP